MHSTNALVELTRRVIKNAAPSEERLLTAPEFPHFEPSDAVKAPFGIGLEPVYLFIAPLVYGFFDGMIKELGKNSASEIKEYIREKITKKEITKDSIVDYFKLRGLDDSKSIEIADLVINEIHK